MTDLFDRCGLPAFLLPWISRFYTDREIELLQWLGDDTRSTEAARTHLGSTCTDDFLHRAWRRGVVKRLADGRLAGERFHVRFESWALFEGWQDLPDDIRFRLNRWELDDYLNRHGDTVERLKAGRPRPKETICPEYLLLGEVKSLFDRIPHFYLWPCNCRAMIGGCRHDQLTCIRFSNDRHIGWEISRERALSIVHAANRRGLMQSAELAVDDQGRFDGALCNCCNDCCFPHQLAKERDAEKIWPLSRYLAILDSDPCNGCGRCVSRCPFDVIYQEKKIKGRPAATPVIDSHRCRGCGVCATACPQSAIDMQKVNTSILEDYYA